MAKKTKPSRKSRKSTPKPRKAPARKPKPVNKAKKRPVKKRPVKKRAPARPTAARPLTPERRRKLREANLKAFSKYLPQIHQRLLGHVPVSRLEIDDKGGPDIVFNDQYFYNKKAKQYVADQMRGYWAKPLRFTLQTLNPKQFDAYAGRFLHDLLYRATKAGMTFAPVPIPWETYFVLSYGVGLGGHIDPLVEKTQCHILMLVEPSLEFVHHSLEVYDWKALFERFKKKKGKVLLFVDNRPEHLARQIRVAIRLNNPISLDGMIIFSHYNNAIFAKASHVLQEDRDLIVAGLGFLDDEIKMIENAHGNLYPGTSKVYRRPTKPYSDLPALVVGSGPSLDRDMDFLRKNADKGVVISCGSAVRPLLVNGIVPDFQVEVENEGILPLVSQVAKNFDLSPVRLLTSVTGERSALKYFKEIIYYFRGSLSPYPIWSQSEEQTIRHCNPTVSNAALSFAQEIGCRNIYLFGTDMGSLNPEVHHSKDSYHYTKGAKFLDQVYTTKVPGNFGGTCHTSSGLYWARDALTNAMKAYSGRRYYNCANGAFIEGAVAKSSSSITLNDITGGKKAIIDRIVDGFPPYSAETFDSLWADEAMVANVGEFLGKVRDIYDSYDDLSDRRCLTELVRLLEDTSTRVKGAMTLMFRGSIYMSQMSFEFYRDRLIDRDRLPEFDEIGSELIRSLLDTLGKMSIEKLGRLSEQAGPREKIDVPA